jgi:hypothetical protein
MVRVGEIGMRPDLAECFDACVLIVGAMAALSVSLSAFIVVMGGVLRIAGLI